MILARSKNVLCLDPQTITLAIAYHLGELGAGKAEPVSAADFQKHLEGADINLYITKIMWDEFDD